MLVESSCLGSFGAELQNLPVAKDCHGADIPFFPLADPHGVLIPSALRTMLPNFHDGDNRSKHTSICAGKLGRGMLWHPQPSTSRQLHKNSLLVGTRTTERDSQPSGCYQAS